MPPNPFNEQNKNGPTVISIPDHDLLRKIGAGNYGEVWLARNIFGAFRAVKIVLRKSFLADKPFQREFDGIKKFEPLSRIYESQLDIMHVGRGEGFFYYVMELADDVRTGQQIDAEVYEPRTLREDLRRFGRVSLDQCVEMGLHLTIALQHLHRNGLIHRDIKPSNIVFVNGAPKLADIGLVTDVDATRSFVGTEGFFPPEGPGTISADLYALGKVIYEAATGMDRKEFPELPVLAAGMGVADVRTFSELNEIIVKACDPDPQRRYRNADDMHADFALLKSGKSVSRFRLVDKRLNRFRRAAKVTLVALLVLLLALLLERGQTRRARELAQENRRLLALASEEQSKERRVRETARLNEYAGDMRAAQNAIEGGRFSAARELVTKHVPHSGEIDLRGVEWGYLNRLARSQALESYKHPAAVACAVLSPDNRLLATGCSDGKIRIWDRSGTVLTQLEGLRDDGPANYISFSPDGSQFASSHDGGVDLCKTSDWTRVTHVAGGTWPIAFSNKGRIVAARDDGGLSTWNLATLEESILSGGNPNHRRPVFAISNDGQFVAIGGPPKDDSISSVQLLNLPTQHKIAEFSGPSLDRRSGQIGDLAFSKDNHQLVIAYWNGEIDLLDVANRTKIADAQASSFGPIAVAYSPDGETLATVHWTDTIDIRKLGTTREKRVGFVKERTLVGHDRGIWSISYSRDGRYLVSCGKDRTAKVWDASAPKLEGVTTNEGYRYLSYADDCKSIWAFSAEEILELIDLRDHALKRKSIPLASLMPHSLPHIIEGKTAILLNREGNFEKFDLRGGQKIATFAMGLPERSNWLPSYNGDFVFMRSAEDPQYSPQLWDLKAGAIITKFSDFYFYPFVPMPPVAFSPDDAHFAYGNTQFDLVIWDVLSKKRQIVLKGHRLQILATCFSKDGSLVASGGADHEVRVWDWRTGNEIFPSCKGHAGKIKRLEFAPDGRTLISESDDGLRFWNIDSGREVLYLKGVAADSELPVVWPNSKGLTWWKGDEFSIIPLQ